MTEIKCLPESQLRLEKIRREMLSAGIDAMLIADNANLYYITGMVFRGYVYISLSQESEIFVIRPNNISGENVRYIRKPEMIKEFIGTNAMPAPHTFALEVDDLPYSDILRLSKVFGCDRPLNASVVMRNARMIKTPCEIELMREDGLHQAAAYARVPHIFKADMTDIEFQVELERELRLEGCLGYYRTSGRLMEINMGSVLNGENADTPTPYDFAVGGGGSDKSLPVGADGRTMLPGTTVMVDMCGNFNGYQTDLTRVWSIGQISDVAIRAHNVSIDILRALETAAVPGAPVSQMYEIALEIVKRHELEKYFMGHSQHAAFIGHGVGIQLNEWPVITPKSKHILEENMCIAIEPKFVIPGVGAVGIENTYRVTKSGLENLTVSPEDISDLTA